VRTFSTANDFTFLPNLVFCNGITKWDGSQVK